MPLACHLLSHVLALSILLHLVGAFCPQPQTSFTRQTWKRAANNNNNHPPIHWLAVGSSGDPATSTTHKGATTTAKSRSPPPPVVLPPILIDDETTTTLSTRRAWFGTLLLATGSAVAPAVALSNDNNKNNDNLQWQVTPVNKRTGVTVFDAEQIYSVSFVTYLSRFLLTFDESCRNWWYERGSVDIRKTASGQQVSDYRTNLFAQFSASVEVGLIRFEGKDGPERLFDALLQRYCGGGEGDDTGNNNNENKIQKEARRQICLLFGLLESPNQPTAAISQQLAIIDNAAIDKVVVRNPGSGYAIGYGAPKVIFPPPPAGASYTTATGRAILTPSGSLLRIDVVNRGKGFNAKNPPVVTISPPAALRFGDSSDADHATAAKAKAFVFKQGPNKGKLERIQLTEPGSGYTKAEIIRVKLSNPDTPLQQGGVVATATAVLEYQVSEIRVVANGTGYSVETPIPVYVEPPPLTARVNLNDPLVFNQLMGYDDKLAKRQQVDLSNLSSRAKAEASKAVNCVGRACYDQPVEAVAYPKAASNRKSIFTANRKPDDELQQKPISGVEGGIPPEPINFVAGGTSQLLALLPSGVGLEFDAEEGQYNVAVDPSYNDNVPLWVTRSDSQRKIDPDFGPRGRAPIERDMTLGLSSYLRFILSGAICCSGVHLALTPIDVVKTKIQTDPVKYPGLMAFKTVYQEGGATGFFRGWLPTFLGWFVWGGISYALTEFIRRTLTEDLGSLAAGYEVPIILLAAAVGSFVGSFIICPFESVRIRTVSQPGYGRDIFNVLERMVREEGISSLFAAVPLFLGKEIPFAMAKFTVFDLSTAWMYQQFPAAREDLQLSLLISLAGGTLGGIAAAVVSNPADVTISTLKKAKSELSITGAATLLVEEGGPFALFTGLPLRMIFYSLVVSLQFLVYDSVRFALGIGSDDLKLYLDVLGGALRDASPTI